MGTSSHDIFLRDALGTTTWIEAVSDIDAAKARVLHLAEHFPAEYLIFHQASASVVANLISSPLNSVP